MKKLFPSNSLKTLLSYMYFYTNHICSLPKLSSKSSLLLYGTFSTFQNHFLLWAGLNHDADVGLKQALCYGFCVELATMGRNWAFFFLL